MINIQIDITDPSACNQMDGAIHITPLNGIAPYEYSITGGASFQADSIFTNLGIGTYIILVRDAQYRFSSFKLATLKAEGAPIIKGIVMSNPTQCDIGGTLKIRTEGGIPPLQFSIDKGETFQENSVFEDVPMGVYNIIVRNGDGSCAATYPTISFAPQSPLSLIKIQIEKENPNCKMADGILNIKVTGGSGDYLYSIDDGATYTQENVFDNLAEGLYQIIVKDTLLDCEKKVNQVTTLAPENCLTCDSLLIEVSATSPNCDSLNGQIVIRASGTSGTYQYSIDNGVNFQTSPIFNGLGEGSHNIIVKDTVYECDKNAANQVILMVEDCPNCDSLAIQSFIGLPNCDSINGRIELTVSGGSGNYEISLNNGPFQNNTTFENLLEGTYTIIVKDLTKGCEKSFSPLQLAAEDCDCTLAIFEEQEIDLMIESCDAQGLICLDIALEKAMTYEILDNDSPYNGGFKGCNFDTMLTYLYFTLPGQGMNGPYHLDRWEVNDSVYTGEFQDINELVTIMNSLDTNAVWERDAASMTLKGGFSNNEYGAFEITQIGTNMMGVLQLNANHLPMGTQFTLDIGKHELIFRDKTTNCSDTLVVNIDCMGCPTVNLMSSADVQLADCAATAEFCFEGISANNLANFNISDNGVPYTGSTDICDSMTIGFTLALGEGNHQIAINSMELGCQYIFALSVACPLDTTQLDTTKIDTIIEIGQIDTICFADLFMVDAIKSIQPNCEGLSPAVAFEINNLTNCLMYEGIREGMDTICMEVCLEDDSCTQVIITVTVVEPDTMEMDTLCADLLPISTTLMLENCLDTTSFCLNIPRADLDQYHLSLNDITYTGALVGCDVPEQAGLELALGVHEIILTTLDGLCSDTAAVTILCEQETTEFLDTVLIMMSDTFCIDKSKFGGELVSIKNVCEEESGEYVVFEIDPNNYCIYYTGVEAGTETACVVTCDDLGMCDTTIIRILVEPEPDTIPFPIAVNDFDTLDQGQTQTINVLGNDTTNSTLITVVILEEPANGTVVVNSDMTITYMPNDTACDITEVFTYELCNPRGCDTATVELYIECRVFQIFNGFSPNGDGVNETFTIEGIENYPNNHLTILNRWGNSVYDKAGYKGQWDGTWNNKLLPSGTYFYLLNDGVGKTYSGYLQIER